jgi:Large eukaryotic DNA virus major capsid protein/Major capsid protein N-terminus
MVLGLRGLINLREGLRDSPLPIDVPRKGNHEKYTERWGIKVQYHEVKISLELRDARDCYWAGAASTAAGSVGGYLTDMTKAEVGSLKAASLFVDYIYLDTDERRRFAQVSHEYLIEQLQFTGDESTSNTNNKIKLSLNHPVRELIWVVQPDDNIAELAPFGKQWFNYTDAYDNTYTSAYSTNTADVVTGNDNAAGLPGIAAGGANAVFVPTSFEGGQNPVLRAKLQLNGHDRFSERDGRYFNLVQPYQHHENVPKKGINVYSFALKPEEHQPSGTCNMSRIDNATLNLTLTNDSVIKGGNQRTCKVRVYGVNYNVLRIMSGMGGLASNIVRGRKATRRFHLGFTSNKHKQKHTKNNTNRKRENRLRSPPREPVASGSCLLRSSSSTSSSSISMMMMMMMMMMATTCTGYPQDSLLFGNTLRALYTKGDVERRAWQRIMNSGMVTVTRIGQPACLSPKPATAMGMERRQRLNGYRSSLRGVATPGRLKIQSIPLGKLWGSETAIKHCYDYYYYYYDSEYCCDYYCDDSYWVNYINTVSIHSSNTFADHHSTHVPVASSSSSCSSPSYCINNACSITYMFIFVNPTSTFVVLRQQTGRR